MNTVKLFSTVVLLIITVRLSAQVQSPGYETLPRRDSLVKSVGSKIKVFTRVFGGKYLPQQKTTLLYVGNDYPNQTITIVIKGNDRNKFLSPPETRYYSKDVLISGIVESYQGKLQIQVRDTSQIAASIETITRH